MRYFKTFLLLISMCLLPNPIKAIVNDTEQSLVDVSLCEINNNDAEETDDDVLKPKRRSKKLFAEKPQLEYGNHILYYNTVCEDAVFVLIQNGTVTYEDDFNSAGIYELPINLNGTYDIHLYVDNKVYVGTLVL